MKWYYRRGSQEVGPIETADLKKLVNRGELGPSDFVWHTDAKGWMRVAEARKLLIGEAAKNVAPKLDLSAIKPKPAPKKAEPEKVDQNAAEADGSTTTPAAKEAVSEVAPPADPKPAADKKPAEEKPAVAAKAPARTKPVAKARKSTPRPTAAVEQKEPSRGRATPATAKAGDEPAGSGGDAVTANIVDRLRRRMEGIQPGEEGETPLIERPLSRVPIPTIGSLDRTESPAPEPEPEEAFADDDAPVEHAESEQVATAEVAKPDIAEPEAPAVRDAEPGATTQEAVQAEESEASEYVALVEEDQSVAEDPSDGEPEVEQTAPVHGRTGDGAEDSADAGDDDVRDADDGDVDDGDADDDAPDAPIEAADAPSKQVAGPVRTQRLPPRDLIADFGPPQSSVNRDKPRADRKDRIRIGKRFGRGRQRAEAEPETDQEEEVARQSPRRRAPASLRRRSEARQAEARAAAAEAARSPSHEAEQEAEARQTSTNGNGSVQNGPIPANPIPADPIPAEHTPTKHSPPPPMPETAPEVHQGSLISPSANQPSRRDTTPREPTAAIRPAAVADAATPAAAAAQAAQGAAPAAAARSGAADVPDRPAGGSRDPRELAKAAAAAVRRERARTGSPRRSQREPASNGADATGGRAPANPETATASQQVNVDRHAAAHVAADAQGSTEGDRPSNVGHLVQPSNAGESVAPSRGRADRFDEAGSSGAMPSQKPAGESGAVRSLPGRQGGTRKKGSAKSRRREGPGIVPTHRTKLSARGDSMRSMRTRESISLGRSYWVHLILLTVVFAGIAGAAMLFLASNARIYPLLAVAAGAAVMIFLFAPWQVSSVWRAANEHVARRDGSLIARVAQASLLPISAILIAAMAFLLVPVGSALNLILKGDGERAYSVKVNRNGTIIQVDGLIEPGISGQVDETIRRSPRAHTLVLNSEGGYLFEARKLRDVIEGSPIRATYTRTGCKGACLLPFMATDERVAEVGSALQIGGPTGADGPLAVIDQRLGLNGDHSYLTNRGIDPETFDLNSLSGFNSSDRHNVLLDSGILTAVSVGNTIFRSENVSDVAQIQVERALLTVPFYDTLQRLEPELFDAFRDGVAAASPDSVERDGLGDRTFDSSSPLVEHVKTAYLPIAPDRSADDLMAVLTALGHELRELDAGACIAVVSPSDDTIGTSIAAFLEVDRRAAFYQAFDQVIITSQSEPRGEPANADLAAFVSGPVISETAAGDAAVEAFLSTGAPGTLTFEQQCDASLAYFQNLRTLNLDERSAAFRQFAVRLTAS